MKNLILFGIIILGTVLRLSFLNHYPLFRDEAALGFNAWAMFKTGADEFGQVFPVVFRSFEVFFLPLYVYLSVPIVAFLNLSVFSARLLSALSGILALFLMYLISIRLFESKIIALCNTFFLSVAPWHLLFSRGTFEGNLGLTLFAAGFYLWLRFIDSKKITSYFLSIVCFILSMYSYQSERVVVPLFGLFAILHSYKLLWKLKIKLVLPSLLGIVLLTPLLTLTFKAGGTHRALTVSLFSGSSGYSEGLVKQIAALYSAYFSPRNLFIDSDPNAQRVVTNFSVFYAFWILPIIIGCVYVYKHQPLHIKLLLAWILIAPIPAALAKDPFHTYRSLLLYFPLTMLVGLFAKSHKWLTGPIILFTLISTAQFANVYFKSNLIDHAWYWDYGYKQMLTFINTLPADSQIVVDDPETTPYIHFLFHKYLSIYDYQKKAALQDYYTNPQAVRPTKINNLEFRRIDWPKERGDAGKIFVMAAKLLPESEFINDPNVISLATIAYPDGKIAFRIVQISKP